MSELSLVFKNARIIDGTGRPSFAADLGVAGDRVAVIGKIENPSANARVIDVAHHVLAPGFIDIHTHYDAQIAWDGNLKPSPEHGVTSLVMGNCSISMAPISREHLGVLADMFYSVEDMPVDLIRRHVPFNWTSFPEYLQQLRGTLGPNVGAMVGHSNLRYFVMGADAQKRAATPAEIDRMAGLLEDAMQAGALGLSLTHAHKDGSGNEMPTFYADRAEIAALCRAMMRSGRGILEDVPAIAESDHLSLLDDLGQLSCDTGVMATFDAIIYSPQRHDLYKKELAKLEEWQRKGARLTGQILIRSLDQSFSLGGTQVGLSKLDSWKDIMLQPAEKRLAAFADAVRRQEMIREADNVLPYLEEARVISTAATANESFVGGRIGDIARKQGKSTMECMLDMSLEDNLKTEFKISGITNADDDVIAELLSHPLTHHGAADAGAHVSQFAGAGDTSYLLEHFVRKLGKFTLEEGVHILTSKVANGWGFEGRGRIEYGGFADLVVFDPDTISRGEEVRVADYPGQTDRWIRQPEGIDHVVVNGELLVSDKKYSNVQPGRLI